MSNNPISPNRNYPASGEYHSFCLVPSTSRLFFSWPCTACRGRVVGRDLGLGGRESLAPNSFARSRRCSERCTGSDVGNKPESHHRSYRLSTSAKVSATVRTSSGTSRRLGGLRAARSSNSVARLFFMSAMASRPVLISHVGPLRRGAMPDRGTRSTSANHVDHDHAVEPAGSLPRGIMRRHR